MTTFLHRLVFEKGCQVRPIAWHRLLEQSGIMKSILSKIVLIIRDRFSKEFCVATFLFSKRVLSLVRSSGLLFTSLYLKQCSSCLQMAYGGVEKPPELLPVMVSLNRKGYPRIIPSYHRLIIMRKDERADQVVQLYLSFFSLCRVTRLAKKVSFKGTFQSIVSDYDRESASQWCCDLQQVIPQLISRYLPWVSEIPLYQGMSWMPTWKSLPSTARVNEVLGPTLKQMGLGRITSSFPSFVYEWDTYAWILDMVQQTQGAVAHCIMWTKMTRFAMDPENQLVSDFCYIDANQAWLPWPSLSRLPVYRPVAGRLGQSIEGGGKRRIFAIGNYLNQRALHPVHNWLMNVLKRLPTDGTFNQDGPLIRLIGAKECHCYDLKSATDRWPDIVLHVVMTALFGDKFSTSVIFSLAFNQFEVPFVKRSGSMVSFVAGQPLGYYSSWPLFALSHHFMMWWCAERVYPGKVFDRYAILGDDVVIADPKVASEYLSALSRVGVEVSIQKSLVSTSGCAEFAKRFRIRDLAKDISPVSAKAMMMFFNPFGLIAIGMKYNCKRFSTLVRIGGSGYRRTARLDKPSRLSAMYFRALLYQGKYELWLGRGCYLLPHVAAEVRRSILKKLRPKDICPPPSQLFDSDESQDFTEYTQLRAWMDLWLAYQKWYWLVSTDPWVPLDDLLDGPYCPTDWKKGRTESDLVRFGLLWQLYDKVPSMVDSSRLPCLPEPTPDSGWLLGGIDGTEFLVRALGLVQPRALSGVIQPGRTVCGDTGGLVRLDHLCYTPIHYKTLGVPDRQVLVDFDRGDVSRVMVFIERKKARLARLRTQRSKKL